MLSRRQFMQGTAATAAALTLGHLVTGPQRVQVIQWKTQYVDFGWQFGVAVEFDLPDGTRMRQAHRHWNARIKSEDLMVSRSKRILRDWALDRYNVILVDPPSDYVWWDVDMQRFASSIGGRPLVSQDGITWTQT